MTKGVITTIDEFRMVLGGQSTPCFFTTEFAKSNSFTLQVVNDNDIVRMGRRENRFNLFGALYSKMLVSTCFPISGYPWQWVETKWRWLATPNHAKLVDCVDDFPFAHCRSLEENKITTIEDRAFSALSSVLKIL